MLEGEPLEDVDKFKYLGSMIVANGQRTEGLVPHSLTCNPVFGHCVKYRCVQKVRYERTLEVFDNDSILHNLRVRRTDGVPSVELRHRLYLTSMPALLVQRRLHWFGHAARRSDGKLIRNLLLPTP